MVLFWLFGWLSHFTSAVINLRGKWWAYLLIQVPTRWETDTNTGCSQIQGLSARISQSKVVWQSFFNGAGHLKFARDERRAWTDTVNSETEHRFDSCWQAESFKHCFFTQISSIIYNPEPWVHVVWKWFRLLKYKDICPRIPRGGCILALTYKCHTKCCCYAQTLMLIISH